MTLLELSRQVKASTVCSMMALLTTIAPVLTSNVFVQNTVGLHVLKNISRTGKQGIEHALTAADIKLTRIKTRIKLKSQKHINDTKHIRFDYSGGDFEDFAPYGRKN